MFNAELRVYKRLTQLSQYAVLHKLCLHLTHVILETPVRFNLQHQTRHVHTFTYLAVIVVLQQR